MSNSHEGRIYIFDTTCLNYFALTNNTSLLEDRYQGRAYVPREVIRELIVGADNHPELASLMRADWYTILRLENPEDLRQFNKLRRRWGETERNRGEAATIILAKRHGYVAVIDELVGRNTAHELGLEVTGTLGILVRVVQDGTLTESQAWAVHEDMVSINPNGFRSPVSTRAEFSRLCS